MTYHFTATTESLKDLMDLIPGEEVMYCHNAPVDLGAVNVKLELKNTTHEQLVGYMMQVVGGYGMLRTLVYVPYMNSGNFSDHIQDS